VPVLARVWDRFRLEHGLVAGALGFLVGAALAAVAHFNSAPDPTLGLLGLTLVALGVQAGFSAFFLSILGLGEDARLRRSTPSETEGEGAERR
jgi:hypothetical protein